MVGVFHDSHQYILYVLKCLYPQWHKNVVEKSELKGIHDVFGSLISHMSPSTPFIVTLRGFENLLDNNSIGLSYCDNFGQGSSKI